MLRGLSRAVLVGGAFLALAATGDAATGDAAAGSTGAAPATEYCVTASVSPAGAGAVAVRPRGTCFPQGTAIVLTARSETTGWLFSHWSGGVSTTANPLAATMDQNLNVVANFVASGATCKPVLLGNVETDDAVDVAVAAGHAYVADGTGGVRVINVANPAAPVRLASFATTSDAVGVAVAGDLLLVAAGSQGLLILDVANPAAPVLKGSYNTPGSATRVAVSGNLAFVADGFSGLLILDVSNPAVPVRKGSYSTPSSAEDVAVVGNLAYVACFSSGLKIVDVSDPAAPKLKGSLDTPGYAGGVAASGGLVAIADASAGLQVIDATDPTHPVLRATVATPSRTESVELSGQVAFIADFASVRIVDLADPAHPAIRGALETPGIATGLALLDGKIYVADGYRGLSVIDAPTCDAVLPIHCLTTSVHPEGTGRVDVEPAGTCFNEGTSVALTGRPTSSAHQLQEWSGDVSGSDARVVVAMTGPRSAHASFTDSSSTCRPLTLGSLALDGGAAAVTFANDTAYVARSGGLAVVDVADAAAPRLVGQTSSIYGPRGLVVSRGHVFSAEAYDGLHIIDVSSPAAPYTVGHYATDTAPENYPAEAVAVKDDLAFLAVNANGLFVLDVSSLAHPYLLAKVDTPGVASGVAVSGSLVLVADGSRGLVILDVTNPANPVVRSTVSTIVAYDVAVRGTTAYVAGGSSDGLQVVDVTSPGAPVVVGRAGTLGTAYVAAVLGRTVALPTGSNLELLDVSDSALPRPAGFWAGATEIEGATLAGTRGYVADGTGLHIVDLATCLALGNVPGAAFEWSPASPVAGEPVAFTDTSTGAPTSWSWQFGTVARSSAQSPTAVFPAAGTYTVTLDATNDDGTGRAVEEVTVRAAGLPPTAGFTFSPAGPEVGQAVHLVDTSTGSVESRLWSFGDGGYDAVARPSHTFAVPGTYTVTLTVGNAFGSTSSSRTIPVSHPASLPFEARLVLPSQARNAGSGTSFYRTSFWMTNSGVDETRVRLRYLPAAGFGLGGAVTPFELTLLPRQSLAFRDVLSEAFGATSNTSGVIVVDVAAGDALPLATSRTYNDDPSGTYGQYIPGVPLDEAMPAEAWLHGLGGDTASRTNVGVVNLSDAPIQATITVHDASNRRVGTPVVKTVDPSTAVQVNKVNLAAGIASLSLFSAKVTATGPFFAYASKLDMVTSDPIFIPGDLTPKTTQWIDGVAQLAGVGGTFFTSNLLLANLLTSPVTAEVAFTERRGTTPLVTKSLTIGAGKSLYYADAVHELTELDLKAGMFKISSPTPIAAWARTYNTVALEGTPGTFGQFIPAFDAADLIGADGAVFQGLSQAKDDTSGFRTNMGMINTGGATVTGSVTVYRKEGSVAGRKDYAVAAGQPILVTKILADVLGAGAAISDATVRVVPSTAGALYVWASMVDNRSTDPTFFRPLPGSAGVADTTPPTNPTTITAWPSPERGTALVSGQWYAHPNPFFEWTGATDSGSGIAGYWVYFGTTATADPVLAGSYQRSASYRSTVELLSGVPHYLRVRAVDLAGNVGSASPASHTYLFDATPPENRAPAGFLGSGATTAWSRSVSVALAATDSVGVVGFYLAESATPPRASSPGWSTVSATKNYSATVTFTLSNGDGRKIVYAWFKDQAGNVSSAASDEIELKTVALDLTGTWVGTLYSSLVPGGTSVVIYLVQKGNSASGTYSTGTGASGTIAGTLSGTTVTFTLTQTTPTCLGSFSGTGIVTGNQISLTYTGHDCWGTHTNGHGLVTRQ